MLRGLVRRHIPSMFQRRLLLLLVAAIVIGVTIIVQAARLTTGQRHREYRQQARQALRTSEYIPTVRGRILDRRGRVLARTEAGWDVKVQYSVITGQWARNQARQRALEAAGHRWSQLTKDQRQQRIEQNLGRYTEQAEKLWQTLTRWRQETHAAFTRSDLNQRTQQIEKRVQDVASHLWSIWQKQRQQKLGQPVPLEEVAKPIREQKKAHVVLPDVSAKTRRRVQNRKARAHQGQAPAIWREVKLDRPKRRRYPFESMTLTLDRTTLPGSLKNDKPAKVTVRGVGAHILGKMRDVWKSDLEGENARPFHHTTEEGKTLTDLGGYRPGDRIGAFGIEAAYEQRLRGQRGKDVHHLDEREQNDEIEIKPTPGRDVPLTLDIKLQAHVQAIMSPATGLMEVQPWHIRDKENKDRLGRPLTGAAVVLDVETSEVLAAVSVPPMPRKTMRRHPERIFKDPYRLPYINRPIARSYPPGSTIKPIMLVSAASAGEYALGEKILCRGYLNEGEPDRYRCWIWKQYHTGHGKLGPAASLERSCNVFYYTLGRRMGLTKQVGWLHRFGLERDSPLALPDETTGELPAPKRRANARQDAILMGIGQGPITWSPLQAAAAYATLTRGGRRLGPTVVQPQARKTKRQPKQLNLDPAAVGRAMNGLYRVVNGDHGTGRRLHLDSPEPIFDHDHLRVYGKSGTADAGDRWIDKNLNQQVDDGEVIPDAGDHAWFMALPQGPEDDRPQYAVAVVVEYGGSGSQVAGPIANQIIHALIGADYLPSKQEGAS